MRRYEAKTNCKSNSDYLLVPLNHSTATLLSGLFNIFFIRALRINPLYDAGEKIKIKGILYHCQPSRGLRTFQERDMVDIITITSSGLQPSIHLA